MQQNKQTWRSGRLQRVNIIVLLSLILLGGVASTLLHVSHAHADDPCGTGVTLDVQQTEPGTGKYGPSTGKWKMYRSTCEANAQSTNLRTQANSLGYCTNLGLTIGTILTFFFAKTTKPVLVPAAIVAFGTAFICEGFKTRLNGQAGDILEANQRCGTKGIYYTLQYTGPFITLSDFGCQSEPTSDASGGGSSETPLPDVAAVALPIDLNDPCTSDSNTAVLTHDDNGYYADTFQKEEATSPTATIKFYQRHIWDENTQDYTTDGGIVQRCPKTYTAALNAWKGVLPDPGGLFSEYMSFNSGTQGFTGGSVTEYYPYPTSGNVIVLWGHSKCSYLVTTNNLGVSFPGFTCEDVETKALSTEVVGSYTWTYVFTPNAGLIRNDGMQFYNTPQTN